MSPGHAVLIGDNNSGKSSVIEAIDLALGPDRINRTALIDEDDFYAGRYLDGDGNPIPIELKSRLSISAPSRFGLARPQSRTRVAPRHHTLRS
jgi:predicted ATP-dependent endonuclease of OLD family